MHLVYMTDIHITSRNPRSRMDNYKESILRKLAYVGDFAKSLNAPVLCGGDIFHTADVSNSLVSETIKVIRQHFDAPITSIAGNHDLFGNNLQTLPKTSYGLLEASGCLYNLRPREAKTIKESRNGKWVDAVTICGYPSSYDLPDTADAYLCRPADKYPTGVPLIQLIHGALYDRIPDNFPFAAVSVSELDVDENAADVVLAGHIHSGFPVTMSSTTGRIFANPGALGRLTTAVSDVNLSVKVAVITIENGEEVFNQNGIYRKVDHYDYVTMKVLFINGEESVSSQTIRYNQKGKIESYPSYLTILKEFTFEDEDLPFYSLTDALMNLDSQIQNLYQQKIELEEKLDYYQQENSTINDLKNRYDLVQNHYVHLQAVYQNQNFCEEYSILSDQLDLINEEDDDDDEIKIQKDKGVGICSNSTR